MKGRAGQHSSRSAPFPTLEALRQLLSRAVQMRHEEFGPLTPNLQLSPESPGWAKWVGGQVSSQRAEQRWVLEGALNLESGA